MKYPKRRNDKEPTNWRALDVQLKRRLPILGCVWLLEGADSTAIEEQVMRSESLIQRDAGVAASSEGRHWTQAMTGLLVSRGHDPRDFELRYQEDVARLGWVGGAVTVRCRSTGARRSYLMGPHSTSFGVLSIDLAVGRFAKSRDIC
jgi:hypothetical protein